MVEIRKNQRIVGLMYFCLEIATESGQAGQYENLKIPESENSNLKVKRCEKNLKV